MSTTRLSFKLQESYVVAIDNRHLSKDETGKGVIMLVSSFAYRCSVNVGNDGCDGV